MDVGRRSAARKSGVIATASGRLPKRAHDVLARYDTDQLSFGIEHRETAGFQVDHQLQHAGQWSVGIRVRNSAGHDIRYGQIHQFLVMRRDLIGRESKSFYEVEFGYDAKDFPILDNRKCVEVMFFEQ